MTTIRSARSARPSRATDEDASTLARVLILLGALWIGVQAHRLLLPALIGGSPILRDFGITADGAGLLAAVYFPIYGLMQIPSGLIADRGGLRRLLVGSSLLLGVVGIAFALAPTLPLAILARAVVGAASSLFWVPTLKLCLQLAPRLYGRSVGIMVAAGSVGGIAALAGLPLVMQFLEWRTVALLTALPLFPLALAMLLLPRGPAPTSQGVRPPAQPASARPTAISPLVLVNLLRDIRFWRLTWPATCWNGVWFGLLTWWPRYARDVLAFDPGASGLLAAAATLALVPGSYLLGALSSHHPAWSRALFHAALSATFVVTVGMLLLPNWTPLVLVLVSLTGALFGGFFIYMSTLAHDVAPERVGAATGLSNCITFFAAFVSPWAMGVALDAVDHPLIPDPVYSAAAYDAAWLVCAALAASGLLGALVLSPGAARIRLLARRR